MEKINFHIHSLGSDGKLTPEEVIAESIKEGVKFICFTDHYRNPNEDIDPGWSRTHFHNKDYIAEVRRLQKEYAGKIDISFGVEMDWFEAFQDWIKKQIEINKFDYVLGSVHFLPLAEKFYNFDFGDGNEEKFKEILSTFKSIKTLVSVYYEQLRLMIQSGLYDAVGHFDYIKRNNAVLNLFSEDEDYYRKEVLSTLDVLAKSKMAMEINLRGLSKSTKAQYPSMWILKEARKRGIPLTIGTDAHAKGQVGDLIEKAYELVREAGYREVVRFKDRKMIKLSI